MRDKIAQIIQGYTEPFPEFDEAIVRNMAEEIVLATMQEIAAALNKAMGFTVE